MSPQNSSWLSLPQRLKLGEVSALKEALWQFACDLRVAIPGIIQSFDSVKQTVVVQLALRENVQVITPDGQGGAAPVSTPTAIKPIVDVPIFMLRAGGFCITFPVVVGDECLVVFADTCIDAWWQSGGVQNQLDRRRHDLSDGVALCGIWNQQRNISSYSTAGLQIRSDDGSTIIAAYPAGQVQIVAASSIVFDGPVTVNGKLTVTGDAEIIGTSVSIAGQDFLSHTHSGVTSGGADTGPVV